MKVRIHRGAHEIGGNCVEVEHDDARLVLDVGRPLSADRDAAVLLPDIAGLADEDESTLGVLISHHHPDHWGLIDQVRAGLPIWMGAATERILRAAAYWTWGLEAPVAGHLEHRKPLEIGPFTVTPYLNDHSAYDAYSMLVEADGSRLFYTGDIRGHGRKAGIFEQLVRDPPTSVDVLLMEGTNLQPGLPDKPTVSETEVEHQFVEQFKSTGGLALVVTSAQNVDRLVTIYRATLQTGRDLVMDAYSADVARATGNDNIPRPGPDWPRIRTYLPRWQAVRIKETEEFARLDDINPTRLYPGDLAETPEKFVMLFSAGEGYRLANAKALTGATCAWSLWDGYLDDPSGKRLTTFLADNEIPLTSIHTSGHAPADDLRRLAEALAPDRVVPIHTLGGSEFTTLYSSVDIQPNGAWWGV